MVRRLIVTVEDHEADGVLTVLAGLGYNVAEFHFETEFGQQSYGFHGIIPVGLTQPRRGRETHVRQVGPWTKIKEGDWLGMHGYRADTRNHAG